MNPSSLVYWLQGMHFLIFQVFSAIAAYLEPEMSDSYVG
jgi:hypothetical protein